jgi:NAD(P)-dependent dehydrogenase (short-subunit alcohol dehydrogenase family)
MRALVTGAARGIGATIAQRLRDDGMEVVTLDRAEGCDLQVDLRTDAVPDLGDVDVCVSNAAIVDTIGPAHRFTDEMWARDIEVNLNRRLPRGAVVPAGHARAPVRADRRDLQRRRALGPAGPGGLQRVEGRARRHGADDRGRERGPRHHRERRAAGHGRDGERARDAARRARARAGDGRMVEPAEIAAVVAFLASRDAGSVTGEEIGVDGGLRLNTMSLT